MAATRIYLKGGPCNGRTVSADQIVGGLVAYIKCRGGFYTASDGQTRPNGNPIWNYAGKTAPGPPGGSGSGQPHVHKGWHDIRRSVNTNMPHALARAQHLTRQALRATSHGGKVKP